VNVLFALCTCIYLLISNSGNFTVQINRVVVVVVVVVDTFSVIAANSQFPL